MTKAKRVDKNQKGIVEQLRKLGYNVEYTYMIGHGFPDAMISFDELFTIPIEFKSKGGKLTEDEIKFHNRYKGYIITAYNLEDVIEGVKQFHERLSKYHENINSERNDKKTEDQPHIETLSKQ